MRKEIKTHSKVITNDEYSPRKDFEFSDYAENDQRFAEYNHLISLACKIGRIYPWKWNLTDNSVILIVMDNGQTTNIHFTADSFMESVHPDDRKVYMDSILEFRRERLYFKFEFRSKLFSEDYEWFELTADVCKNNEAGISDIAYGTLHDITDKKYREQARIRYEKELLEERNKAQQATQKMNLVLNNITTALVHLDRNYIVEWESASYLEALSIHRKYVPGKRCYETVYGHNTPCQKCPLTEMFNTGKSAVLISEEYDLTIKVKSLPITNESGEITGGILQIEDITREAQQEREIIEAKEMLEFAHQGAGVVPWEISPETGIISAPSLNVTGYGQAAPMDAYINEYVHPDYKKSMREEIMNLRTGRKETLNIKVLALTSMSNKEKYDWIHSQGRLIRKNGNIVKLFGTQRVVTTDVEREEELIRLRNKAEESNKLKSAFLANMSHEIRTPLNSIVGFANLLPEIEDRDEQQQFASIMQRNADVLLQLISDILDLSKIEAGTLETHIDELNVNEMCDSIVKSYTIKNTKIPIVFREPEYNYTILSDRCRLIQVITNFINNALKFSEEGQIILELKSTDDENGIEISVTDSGTGIEEDNLAVVFDRFVKLNSYAQGTGLGLAICRSIIEQLGGQIGVESQIGVGSRFWFKIPFK